jgi:hypothetical protein
MKERVRIGLVSIAYHASNLPNPVFLLPEHGKLEGSAVFFSVLLVAETVRPYLHSPIAGDGIHFQTGRHQLPVNIGRLLAYLREPLLRLQVARPPWSW